MNIVFATSDLYMDEYMTILYGEKYMDIPSPNKREKHLCWSFKLPEDN